MRRPCLPLLAALLQPATALAESLVELRDPSYGAARGAAEDRPVPARVRQLVHPTVGMPALVTPGATFTALVRARCEPSLETLEARAELVRAPSFATPLQVLGRAGEPGLEGAWRLLLRAPLGMASDSYHLALDDGDCLRDRQPSALRVHPPGAELRIAVLADEQLGDPTGLLPGGEQEGELYPSRGLTELAARRRLQVREELELLDPLFVLYPGDLCFGMDYPAEYAAVVERLASARLAVFAVPGNHDAYATHSVTTRPGWAVQVPKAAFCVGRFSPTSPIESMDEVGACALARLADVLDFRLETDGLRAWHHSLGPDSYAFRAGGVRFVGLNTYGGSVARRTAVPFSLGRLRDWVELDLLAEAGVDPLLGAPLVDNFGGFLGAEELAWVEQQARQAREAGEGLLLFGHHDPGGLYLGELAVRPNDPFGEDPVARGGFETWNHDTRWDSDPEDGIGVETATAHSGARLLRALGPGPATVVVGHAHYDADRELPAAGGGALRLVQATSAGAGLAHDGAYRGYRLLRLDADGALEAEAAPELGWASLPLGNFWVEERERPDGPPDRVLVSGLPRSLDARLRVELPPHERGYRFVLEEQGRAVRPAELAHGPDGLVAWLELELPRARPAGLVAGEPRELARSTLRWERAEDNEPPQARIARAGRLAARPDRPLRGVAGRELRLSAAGSRDEDALLAVRWRVGGLELEGLEPSLRLERPGRYTVALEVVDACGALGREEAELRVRPGLWPWRRSDGSPR